MCRDAIREENLRSHFHKLLGYSSCSVNFLLTYTFRDVSETERRLRFVAENNPPDGFECVDVVDLPKLVLGLAGFMPYIQMAWDPLESCFLSWI